MDNSNAITHIFDVFFNMIWQIYWPLAFGLILSSFIRGQLPVETVIKHLGKTNLKSLTFTTLLGMMSSSCSYAAASISHTLLLKKATLPNAMAFLVSSTNLILEMFIVLVALMGWTFLWGEILGGLLLITFVAFLFKFFYPKDVEIELRKKLDETQKSTSMTDCGMDMSSMAHKEEKMSMDMPSMAHKEDSKTMNMPSMTHKEESKTMDMPSMAHKEESKTMDMPSMAHKEESKSMDMPSMAHKEESKSMDMPSMAHKEKSKTMENHSPKMPRSKLTQAAGYFYMDLGMIGKEIIIGVVVSSILIATVPLNGWRELFISSDANIPAWLHSFLDVLIGIGVAVIAYVCSVGNLLLAAALWHGGISFGGVIGFILSDVLTIPMIRVYYKYYGARPAKWMVFLLFIAILATGLSIDTIFMNLGIKVSTDTLRPLIQDGLGLNFTSLMNVFFIPFSIWFYFVGKKADAGMKMNM